MFSFEQGFIMLCSGDTEGECLQRGLFGDKAQKMKDLAEIKPGDAGLLFNYDRDELLGIFRAASKAQFHIEPKAWKGKFAAQIRVEVMGQLQRIKDATFILNQAGVGMGPLATGVPVPKYPVYERKNMEKILAHFGEPMK